MSITSNRSDSNRQTIASDTVDLKGFHSGGDFFEGSKENVQVEPQDDVRNELSVPSMTLSSFDNNAGNNSFETKESLSSIQELLFYVEETEARNFDSNTNKYNDFMRIEIARESYCDLNKNDKFKRNGSLMKLSKAHCICPIASNKLEIVNQELQCLSCEPSHEHKRTLKSQIFVFEVEPYSVLFLNCEPGKTYVKTIKITNRSEWYQKFEVNPLPKHSPFEMKIILPAECDRNTIAAGLSFRIRITYSCKGHENYNETLRIDGGLVSPIIVQVAAYQCPPILAALADSENLDEMTGEQAVVICNSCLPTESTVTRVELLNYSKTFKFLILDKEMWSLQSLDALCTNDNKLVAGVFTISPAYFQTNSEAAVVINIQFNPKEAGKYCKKLYIVCDNMCVKSLQLIGQAYLFEKNMLQFLNMDKTYYANVNDFIQAEYFFNVGKVYRGRKKKKMFSICNKSACTLHFHWELHRYPLHGFKKMTSRMIKLSHKQGILMGKKSRKFSVTVNMTGSTEGECRTLACLYVDNLTGEKVDDSFKRNLLNRSRRKGYSLLVAIIEIHVQCECVTIETLPRVISLGRIPLLCGPQHKYSTQITVKNKSSIPVRCAWKNSIFNDQIRVKLEVQPETSRISAKTERIFVISITGISPGCFSQYLVCTANRNDCKIGILVEGECTMGFLHVRDDFISCGVIRKDNKLRVNVSFENYTNCKWSRMLSEYKYHSRKSYKLPKLADSSKQKSCKRFLAQQHKKRGLYDNFKRLITFQYNKVNTNIKKNVIWCSLLKWKLGDAVDYIGVIADIQRPLVTLSENEISEDDIQMNNTSIIRLELRNHSRIPASFTWCEPIGDQRSFFECKFEPARGILNRYEKCQIEVQIKPLKMIIIEDLHFICIVEGMVSPLLVSLTGKVQPVIIELNWQEGTNDTVQCTSVWQSMEDNSATSGTSEDSNCENPTELSMFASGGVSINDAIDDVLTVNKIEEDLFPVADDNKYDISLSSNMEQKSDFIGKIVIEVDSCQNANKTGLLLQNCTKATVSYYTNVLNFHPNQESISKQIIPDEGDYRKWKSLVQPEMGVVICVQNPLGQVNGYETAELCVWAFATSWGIYHDVLKIDGDGQLPSVSFELEIICTSNPIRFPALCKPVLRLCAIHYQDNIQSYPIRVKNNCSSNILVHWSIHNILDYSVLRKERPFKLDLCDASENVKNWGLTLNPFYGNVYLDTFSVDEPYFRLEAWTERILTLNINPCDVKSADNAEMPLALNAVLVGCVFRDPDHEQKHPKWDQSRMAALETAYLLIKINVDKPKLVLLHDEVESMLQFFVRGEALWNSNIHKQSKTFIWQNQSSVSTFVSMEIDEPFKIDFRQNGVKLNSIDRQINLKNGELVEMLMTLQIMDGNREIENLLESSPLAKPSTQAEELCGQRLNREKKTVKIMEVFLDGHLDQAYNVELIITLPKFKLSTRKIMFDSVFNGTTKCQTFDIESEDCCPINYEIVAANPIADEENVFMFYPSSGVVTTRKVPATISVYFTPKLSIYYRTKFLVKSSIPAHQLQLFVSGHGTYNSKHMGNEFLPK